MTKKITTIRLAIDIYANGTMQWHDFDCELYIDCEKCKCFEQCLKLRKVLDSLMLSNNKLGR